MTLKLIKSVYPALATRLRAEGEPVKLQSKTRNTFSDVVAFAARHYMSLNPGVDYNAAVLATAGEDYMVSVNKYKEQAAAEKQVELAALDTAAKHYMASHPGIGYVDAVKATAGANYTERLTQDSEWEASTQRSERAALHDAANQYILSHPGVTYLAALKAVGVK